MNFAKILALVAIPLFFFLGAGAPQEEPVVDLIFYNGTIFTGNRSQPWAKAIAIGGGRVLYAGSTRGVAPFLKRANRVVNLKGRLLLPGFNDSHLHLRDGGFSLTSVNLRGARSEKEFARILEAFVKTLPQGKWVLQGQWDHEKWPSKSYPNRSAIDGFTEKNPVLLDRVDGHMALANSLALQLAGITASTPNPQGGEIVKDPLTGEPTGILKDQAITLVSRIIPPPTLQERREAFKAAALYAVSLGITSVQDITATEDLPLLEEMNRTGDFPLRFNPWLRATSLEHYRQLLFSPMKEDFKPHTIKIFVDGSLGARTALLFSPYKDAPSTSGLAIHEENTLNPLVEAIHRGGFQIAAHAIGDRANRMILDAIERAQTLFPRPDSRHRIEHAQILRNEELHRFQKLGVVASVQPVHLLEDMPWAEKRLGARISHGYRYNSLRRSGVVLAFGTDWPFAPLDPREGLYAAVARCPRRGGNSWSPSERLNLQQAVESYTQGSAYADFQEDRRGILAPGYDADIVVLDRNLFLLPPSEILKARVDFTIIQGRIVYDRLIQAPPAKERHPAPSAK